MKLKTRTFFVTIAFSTQAQYTQEVKNAVAFVHNGVALFDFAGPGEGFVAASFQRPALDVNVYTVAPRSQVKKSNQETEITVSVCTIASFG